MAAGIAGLRLLEETSPYARLDALGRQLRDAILGLVAQPQRRQAMGARGREVAKNFTADAMCRKYLELYESVLGPLA